jgi:hypothetical protein
MENDPTSCPCQLQSFPSQDTNTVVAAGLFGQLSSQSRGVNRPVRRILQQTHKHTHTHRAVGNFESEGCARTGPQMPISSPSSTEK